MDQLRRAGRTGARLVGLTFTLLGAWVLGSNLVSLPDLLRSSPLPVTLWILLSGASGGAGGTLFLLSFDGPERFRMWRVRAAGWAGMLVLALLPTSLTIPLLGSALLVTPALLVQVGEGGAPGPAT